MEHEVSVFAIPGRQHSRLLRTYLATERLLYRTKKHARMVEDLASEIVCETKSLAAKVDYEIVLDLAGEGRGERGSDVLSLQFDGSCDERALAKRLVGGRAPIIDVVSADGSKLASSYPFIGERGVLGGALNAVFERCQALLVRAATRQGNQDHVVHPRIEVPDAPPQLLTPSALLSFVIRNVFGKVVRLCGRIVFRQNHWLLACGRAEQTDCRFRPPDVQATLLSSDAFYADPFLFRENGTTYLFVEKFPYSRNRGEIVWTIVHPDGRLGSFRPALKRPYHLSYPQILCVGGEHFMLPETGRQNFVELFRATKFPDQWERDCLLLENVSLADPTVICRDGHWWMFATQRSHDGSPHDELVIYHSKSLRGPWLPHAANPVVSDCRYARPAGRIVEREGRLFRPAQDCEFGYGTGIVWNEIHELTETTFRETRIARWSGTDFGKFAGVHTYDQAGDTVVVDLKAAWFSRLLRRHST